MDTKAERSSMSEDFFGDLGKSISRYTQNAVDKTVLLLKHKDYSQISAKSGRWISFTGKSRGGYPRLTREATLPRI
jgi:hypothetical protein